MNIKDITFDFKKNKSVGKIISLSDFERGLGIKITDDITREGLLWIMEVAKRSNVNVNSLRELTAFANYLLITIKRVGSLLNYMSKNNIDLNQLEVLNSAIEQIDFTKETQ